jgi:succinate dehydrogenase flavin-adding protein (antitoxin of CptAB toxin-antitoxin module)
MNSQLVNMMLYRAKQRGFLELDLLMVRARATLSRVVTFHLLSNDSYSSLLVMPDARGTGNRGNMQRKTSLR